MSFECMAWAVKQKVPAMEKVVLLLLADRTNGDDGRCFPSHKKLAEDCGMSERSLRDQLKKLAERGLIEIVQRVNEGVNLPNQYNLLWHGVIQGGMAGAAGGYGSTCRGVGQDLPTNLEVNQEENQSKVVQLNACQDAKECHDVLAYLNTKAGKSYRTTDTNLAGIRARLKEGATVAEIKQVIDAKVLDWKGKTTPEGKNCEEWLNPTTLFRPANYEKYRNNLPKGGAAPRSKFAGMK